MMQEKLPSASVIPVTNQGFKLSPVDNSVVLIRHSFSLLLMISSLTIEEVEYLLQDILIGAKLNCLGLTENLSGIIDRKVTNSLNLLKLLSIFVRIHLNYMIIQKTLCLYVIRKSKKDS